MSAYQYESIEVLVYWRERILAAHTYNGHVVLGENLRLPGLSGKNLLVRRGSYFGLNVGPGTTAISRTAKGSRSLDSGLHVLESDETVRLSLPNNLLSLECRRIARPPQATTSPAIDWSASEVAGGVLALAVTLLLAGYSALVKTPLLLREEMQDVEKIAKVKFQFHEPQSSKAVDVAEVSAAPVSKPPASTKTQRAKASRAKIQPPLRRHPLELRHPKTICL